jgi:ribokinase
MTLPSNKNGSHKILVFGSINIDLGVTLPNFPQAGETLITASHSVDFGGKGANQALSAAFAGANVYMIGAVGTQDAGIAAIQSLYNNGVNIDFVKKCTDTPSGTAFIIRDTSGENQIIVSAGANYALKTTDVPTDLLESAPFILLQREVLDSENWALVNQAFDKGCAIILNNAPAADIPEDILPKLHTLILNQTEAAALAKHYNVKTEELKSRTHVQRLIITLGAEGVMGIDEQNQFVHYTNRPNVHIVDTTGAGDCFTGSYAAQIAAGESFYNAIAYATHAATLSCAHMGIHTAYPKREHVLNSL